MKDEEQANEIIKDYYSGSSDLMYVSVYTSKEVSEYCMLEMARWKNEQFKEQLSSLKDEIQSNLCASSGFNDEYSRGYQDCGMKVMEMIDKILEV